MNPLLNLALALTAAATSVAAPPPHAMSVVVRAERILIANEFVPRYLDLPKVLVVRAGETFTPPTDSTWDYIEVAGTLRIDRTRDTVLRFTHLFVLPGGVLDVGTTTDPIPANRHVELIVRDVPINIARDPFQWGNGLLNFNRQTRVGAAKTAWTTLTGDVAAGARELTLASDPQGWRVGDELLLPDTRQTAFPALPRREPSVTIVAIDGRTITLSKPLDFEHLALRDPDNRVVLLPRVANLTRNIVVRSEALGPETGTPGHTANVGEHATWDVRYNTLVGLGRTRAVPLDNTVLATGHIGTNQQGRYSDHQHHAQGFGSSSVGNVNQGSGRAKWGVVVHGTHDALIEDTIAVGFPGAGFVTEDGYEVRNIFRRNFAAYSVGNHTGAASIEEDNAKRFNNPGSAGAGFWFRGLKNVMDRNEAWNNAIGMNVFGLTQVEGHYPSVPGGEPDTTSNRLVDAPLQFTNNVTAANAVMGLEYWGAPKFRNEHHVSAFNGIIQFFHGLSDPTHPHMIDPLFVGSNGMSQCTSTATPYAASMTIDGGRIVGCRYGIGGAAAYVRIKGTELQNVTNILWPEFEAMASSYQEDVKFRAMPGLPPQNIVFGHNRVWSGVLPLPVTPQSTWIQQQGSQHRIKNWQGTGRDYRLFIKQQLASTPAWPSLDESQQQYNCPEDDLTMGQCWAKYGLAYGGAALTDAEAVPLEGLVAGFAAAGLDTPLGPPRAVITFPTSRAAAPIERQPDGTNGIAVYAMLTGESTGVSPVFRVSVDGGAPFDVGGDANRRRFVVRNLSEGSHEIRTWRLDAKLHAIESSLLTFRYAVGASPAKTRAQPR